MSDLKYKVIQSEEQYYEYCKIHKELVFSEESEKKQDEIELLGLLIKDWDEKHKLGPELDPVELVKAFMDDHEINQSELAEIAGVGKGYMSEMLNYKKRLSRNVVRNIAKHFKIRQEALNKPYRLEGEKVDQDREKSNISPVFDINTGNEISYTEEEDQPMYVRSQGNLEYSEAK